VQATHRRRSRTWWWKNGQLVDGGLVAATADHAPASAIAKNARTLHRASNGLFLGGMFLQLANMGAFAALEATRGDWVAPATLGIGITVVAALVGTSLPLMLRGWRREQEATNLYNAWAVEHGCHDPPQAATSSAPP
jgi:hypothetical protein